MASAGIDDFKYAEIDVQSWEALAATNAIHMIKILILKGQKKSYSKDKTYFQLTEKYFLVMKI